METQQSQVSVYPRKLMGYSVVVPWWSPCATVSIWEIR